MLPLPYSPKRHAFTLIEILVVLAIVTMLAALLFSVFGRARNSANSATCASNLRQIGTAFRLYLNDSRSLYPGIVTKVTPEGTAFCTWTHSLAPYVKEPSIFNCPKDPDQFYVEEALPDKKENEVMRYYDGAYLLNTPNEDKLLLNDREIRYPSQMILVLDGANSLGLARPIAGKGLLTPENLSTMDIKLRHEDGVNALFADGHVKHRTASQLLDRSQWTLSGTDVQPTPSPWTVPTLPPN